MTNIIFNQDSDCHTCPQGKTLNTTGGWYKNPGIKILVIILKITEDQNVKLVQ